MFKIIHPITFLFILLLSIFLCSCATVLNGKYHPITIRTKPDSATVIVNNKDTMCCTPLTISFERSNEDILLDIHKDTTNKHVIVTSELSNWFLWGNLFGPGIIGYAVDITNNKRFTYPENMYVDLNREGNNFRRWIVNDEVPLNITLSLPYLNHYYLKKENSAGAITGFLGCGAGVEYYLNYRSYLSWQIGISSAIPLPIPTSIDFSDKYEMVTDVFTNLRYNKRIDRLQYGMGFSYQVLSYNKHDYSNSQTIDIETPVRGLGLSLSTQYQLSPFFFVGLLYEPMIYNLTDSKYDYHHHLCLEVSWKVKLSRN